VFQLPPGEFNSLPEDLRRGLSNISIICIPSRLMLLARASEVMSKSVFLARNRPADRR